MLLIHLYVDAQGQHRWSIRARNGRIISDGAQGYSSAAMRNKGLGRVIKDLAASQYMLIQAPLAAYKAEQKPKRKYTKRKKRKYTKKKLTKQLAKQK